jgi:hypothetical protein
MIFYVRVIPGDEYDRYISGRQHSAGIAAAGPAGVPTPTVTAATSEGSRQ